ncbi:MAG: outer membrane protein transport protein [Proteobacteria bacterium]|nr:outer membrane protein transport protein [Pseudomonadota bacterium]
MQRPIRTIISSAVLSVIAANAANAGSFSLYTESSPAAIGNYAAGIAAEAADASTGWYNPAGLSLIHSTQAVVGVVGVYPSAKLTGTSTFTTLPLDPYSQSFSGLQGAKTAYVPSFHAAMPLGPNVTVGFSTLAPFGLATQWFNTSPVRYSATTSRLLTSNFAPEIGAKVTEHFALGLGIDLQYARVKFNRVLGSPALLQEFGAPATTLDSLSYNRGQSFGVGFHTGLMGIFNDNHTRIGVNYQSQMKHHFNGYNQLHGRLSNLSAELSPEAVLAANPTNSIWNSALSSNNIALPDVVTVSGYQDINQQFAVLASAVYTGWSSLKTIQLNGVSAYSAGLGQVLVNSSTSEYYRDTWRFAVGANYHYDEKLMIRAGTGYDQTPTRDRYRDIRVPDSDRWAASVGAHYQVMPSIGVDLGYTHLFSVGKTRVNKTDTVGTGSFYNINAKIDAQADLVGLQAVWTLDAPVEVTK